jgi:hypothetical protein
LGQRAITESCSAASPSTEKSGDWQKANVLARLVDVDAPMIDVGDLHM